MNAKRHKPATSAPAARKVDCNARKGPLGPVKGLIDARTLGEDQAVIAQPHIKRFSVYFPTQLYQGSTYSGTAPRVYWIRDETGKRRRAYRLVVSKGVVGEYYGIEGHELEEAAAALRQPDSVRTIAGRRLLIYKDASQVRIVAWRTSKAVYWVSNTLTNSLTPAQMIWIASSMRALKH